MVVWVYGNQSLLDWYFSANDKAIGERNIIVLDNKSKVVLTTHYENTDYTEEIDYKKVKFYKILKTCIKVYVE